MSRRTIIAVLIMLGAFIALKIDHSKLVAPVVNVTDNKVFCTQEAKQCPDGSYVGRTGSACEFASCPTNPAPTPTNPPTITTGTIKGVITLSPVCGVQKDPPDPNCAFRAYQTTIYFNGPGVTYKATSNSNGQYSIKLPAGNYKVHAQGGELYPMCPATDTVIVETNKTVTKDIDCESGIR